jgi:hypothetical protein
MAWKPDYATTAELKAHLRVTDTDDDTPIAAAIAAASRAIDDECHRQFGVVSPAVARTYSYDHCLYIDGRPALPIDDLSSSTGLVVAIDEDDTEAYATTLTNGTDFTLWPYNASLDGKPWTHLLTRGPSAYRFPTYPNSIRVTGLFGWLSVPPVVKTACLIQAARFFVRRDAAFGVAGSPEAGSELRLLDRLDPDVALLLTSVKRHWGAV